VPINEYPSVESFSDALAMFGSRVRDVCLLSLLASDDEAMILYDTDVGGVGPMRIVEHLTVADDRIVKIRHIHDTAALRAAGGGASASTESIDESYSDTVDIDAPPESVFGALTTLEGIAGWWTSNVTGNGSEGGRLDLGFDGLDEHITMQVEEAESDQVTWRCERHTGHPEWEGTTITFSLTARTRGTRLAIHHRGLVPTLECYEQCFAGWQHFARSIKAYVELGHGRPFTAGRR